MSLTERPVAPATSDTDPAQAIAAHLAAPENVVRCAAARALGALGGESAAAPLAGVLMDPDPDLRADAMAALARCARPEDAPTIRRSLAGDPVAEVKVAAVRAVARLKDRSSVGLLRALARSRCEAEVAWEELDGGWDDWLDVQVAAIEALGAIGADEAVDDLIEIREDEEGQDLDHVVFAALARLPARGVPALRGFLEHRDARVRERALAALSTVGRDALAPLREALVRDPSPDVRRLAIDCFDESDETLAALASNDPDAAVRCAALARAAPARPDVWRSALRDPDEAVRAVALEARGSEPALEARGSEPAGSDEPDLVANVEAWLRTAAAPLATVCAAVLPTLAGTRSLSALCEAAEDAERHPEVRIAALHALGRIETQESVAALSRAAVDRARQVRLAALAALVELSGSAAGDVADRSRAVLTDAVRGSLAPEPSEEASDGRDGPPAPEVAARHDDGKADAAAPDDGTSLALTPPPSGPDDEASGTDETEPAYPRSTLDAIGGRVLSPAQPGAAPAPSDDGGRPTKRTPKIRPGRVAVEGPDDFSRDLRVVALRLTAECTGDGIEEALAEAAASTLPALRTAAFEAIARRAAAMPLSPDLTEIAVEALQDGDPSVRAAAARARSAQGDAGGHLAPLLDDPDDGVRAAALKAVAAARPEKAASGLRDPSTAVRSTALDGVAGCGQDDLFKQAMKTIVEGGFTDTLNQACRRHPVARQVLLGMLREAGTLSPQDLLMILDAVAHAMDSEDDRLARPL